MSRGRRCSPRRSPSTRRSWRTSAWRARVFAWCRSPGDRPAGAAAVATAGAFAAATAGNIERQISIAHQVQIAASDYQLQMQAYALAVSELMPALVGPGNTVRVTLHFLEPDIEFQLEQQLLSPDVCMSAIDNAMTEIVGSLEPHEFPVRPAMHCLMCNFRRICPAGRDWVRSSSVWPGQNKAIHEMT